MGDHLHGVVITLLVRQVAHSVLGRRLANDVGGQKRLNALSTIVSTVILSPWSFILYVSGWEFKQMANLIGLVWHIPVYLASLCCIDCVLIKTYVPTLGWWCRRSTMFRRLQPPRKNLMSPVIWRRFRFRWPIYLWEVSSLGLGLGLRLQPMLFHYIILPTSTPRSHISFLPSMSNISCCVM